MSRQAHRVASGCAAKADLTSCHNAALHLEHFTSTCMPQRSKQISNFFFFFLHPPSPDGLYLGNKREDVCASQYLLLQMNHTHSSYNFTKDMVIKISFLLPVIHTDLSYNSLEQTCIKMLAITSESFWFILQFTTDDVCIKMLPITSKPYEFILQFTTEDVYTNMCLLWQMYHTESANNSLKQTYESNVLAITCELHWFLSQ